MTPNFDMPKTAKLLERGDALREHVNTILEGIQVIDDQRSTLLCAYLSLAIENHQSVAHLTKHRAFGSAFGLLRSIVEIVFRAHWVIRCATEAQVSEIHQNDRFPFPGLGAMAKEIDKAYGSNFFFQNWKMNAWDPLNSYAHSGLLALGRRFLGGNVQPNYTDQEVFEAIRASNASLTLLFKLFLKHIKHEHDAVTLESFLDTE